jgi:hypothetical protein
MGALHMAHRQMGVEAHRANMGTQGNGVTQVTPLSETPPPTRTPTPASPPPTLSTPRPGCLQMQIKSTGEITMLGGAGGVWDDVLRRQVSLPPIPHTHSAAP